MPPEIADSDAESDIASPKAPAYSPIDHDAAPIFPTQSDPIDNVDFSQYLSPTQRLSSMIEEQDDTAPRTSTGSTDRLLNGISNSKNQFLDSTTSASMDESMQSRTKRRFSEIEDGVKRVDDIGTHQNPVKRNKTYGNTRSQRSDTASSLFSEIPDLAPHTTHLEDARRPKTMRPTIDGSFNSFQTGQRTISTTHSSTNGYQGFEMDFRGAGVGMDVNANPFGSLSQVSVGSEGHLPEVQLYAPALQQGREQSNSSPGRPGAHETLSLDNLAEMATSPEQKSSSGHRPADTAPDRQHDSALPTGADFVGVKDVAPVTSKPKKRGRKPKNAQPTTQTNVEDVYSMDELPKDDDDMPPKEQYKARPSRSRAGTVDLVSQPSETEQEVRKPERQKAADASHRIEPSSDLHLSDPHVIGAPVEVYNPRPSKSRARRVAADDALPNKEEPALPVVSQEGPHSEKVETPASKSTTKPGKKGKAKKSKTPAKRQEMPDEGTENVIVMNVQPDKVGANSPSDASPVKEEQEQSTKPSNDEEKVVAPAPDEDQESNSKTKPFTIDIPPATKQVEETELPKPEPKKRGRKPKKKIEVLPEPEPEPEPQHEPTPEPTTETTTNPLDQEVSNSDNETRQPLQEKDTNTLTPTTTNSAASKDLFQQSKSNSSSKPPSSSSSPFIKPRIGLSRRTFIPSLLRKLDRTKEPPKVHEKKEKLSKKQKELEDKRKLENEVDGLDEGEGARWQERGKDGMLVEWDD